MTSLGRQIGRHRDDQIGSLKFWKSSFAACLLSSSNQSEVSVTLTSTVRLKLFAAVTETYAIDIADHVFLASIIFRIISTKSY